MTLWNDHVAAYFGRDSGSDRSLEGLRVLDIGCGGGLLCEPMARLGADVVGVDPSEQNIGTASVGLLDTSDAADDQRCVELGGRRSIKKKQTELNCGEQK